MNSPDREVECTIPILPVRNLDLSIHFYTEKLGFILDWRGGPVCSVSRDARPIMLKQSAADSTPGWVWIGLESEALFHLYRERGVKILQEPMNWSWAYEMKFEDPDGNVLWLGTEPRNDLPKQDHA